MLQEVDFKPCYTSGGDEPSDFLYEGLTHAQQFDLGLGYFRSTGFSCLALGFATFLQRGGAMRFIINDSLAPKDKHAILQGLAEPTDAGYEQALLADLQLLTRTLTKRDLHFFSCLSWLVSAGRLQLVAVVPRRGKVGIVHHKFGTFTDEQGDQATFNGSLNFSQYALQYNVESIWCEYSWEAQGKALNRMRAMIGLFEKAWKGESDSIRTIPLEQVKTAIRQHFPRKPLKELVEMEYELATEFSRYPGITDASKRKMMDIAARLKHSQKEMSGSIGKPVQVQKWEHQEKAVASFLKKKRGVLQMATGTGKTHTCLKICRELMGMNALDSIVVTCDGTDLLHQWYRALLGLVNENHFGWAIFRQYEGFYEGEKYRGSPQHKILLTSRPQLDNYIRRLDTALGSRLLLVHDEVHKLGSAGNRQRLEGLADPIRYRLGLSATPEREYDEEGTAFIFKHIGPVIFEFSLEDAIRKGILAPFTYYPVPYRISAADRARLRKIYRRKAACEKAGNPMRLEDFWNEIAAVYKTATGKLAPFRNFIRQHPQLLENAILFVETKEFGEAVLNLVHAQRTDFHTYFGEDDSEVLQRFSRGEIKCLLTCHRLSEGIDIPSLQHVFLLSSARAKLETIQRIGRCLRKDPAKPGKMACVIDFIRENENNELPQTDKERQEFLQYLATIRPEETGAVC